MLRIAPDLALPDDAVTQAIAILARRGAGKTHTASVLVEEVVAARLPVVVLDPTGAWWGLRSSADGTRPGLPVVILGGEHGDVPLESTAGKVIADVVVDHPGAYVIDLSGFESKRAETRFSADFLERLYRAKATRREPLLVVVDEADAFAPQRPLDEQTRTLGALEAIVRRGRIRGLGVVLISQRSAVLNKNVLTQCEVLVAMQTTGPQDRAAIDDWIKGNGTPDERDAVLGSLASLERGEAWVWSPSWLRILQRVRIRRRETFDSSKTPEAGTVAIEPRAFADVDLAALGRQIAASVEQGKANDPAELRRRITALEGTVELMREANRKWEDIARRAETEVRVERVEVPVLNGQVEKLVGAVDRLVDFGRELTTIAEGITAAIGRVSKDPTSGQVERAPRDVPDRPARGRGETAVATLAPVAPRRTPAPAVDGPAPLGRADRALLTALVQFPAGLSRVRLSLISGYSIKSSSFANALGALRSAGLVERSGEPIRATDAGVAAVPDAPPPPSRHDLMAYWSSRLGRAERALLEAMVVAHPRELTKDELSANTGYSVTSSSFANALGRLRSLELIDGFRVAEDLVG